MVVCQTNFIPDLRCCTIRGEHEHTCDGAEYRWSEDAGTEIATGKDSRGCNPRRAQVGFVCGPCHKMILAGVNAYSSWSRALIGVTREGGGGRALGYTPYTGLELDTEAPWSHWRTYPDHLETWLSPMDGAEHAIRFGLKMRGALRRHPTKEAPKQRRRTCCPDCGLLTLVWNPPTYQGGPVIVKCRNTKCGHVVPESKHDTVVLVEETAPRKRAKR